MTDLDHCLNKGCCRKYFTLHDKLLNKKEAINLHNHMKLDNVSGYKVYNVYNTLIRYTKYILKLKDGKLLNKKEAINLHKPIKLDNVSGYKVYNVYNKIHKLYSYKLKLKDGWLLIIFNLCKFDQHWTRTEYTKQFGHKLVFYLIFIVLLMPLYSKYSIT